MYSNWAKRQQSRVEDTKIKNGLSLLYMEFLLFERLHELFQYAGGNNRNVQVGWPYYKQKGCGIVFNISSRLACVAYPFGIGHNFVWKIIHYIPVQIVYDNEKANKIGHCGQ